MLRKAINALNLLVGAALTIEFVVRKTKEELDKLAAMERVYNERQYVMVRLARGHYKGWDGLDQMAFDYEFYKTISKFHE